MKVFKIINLRFPQLNNSKITEVPKIFHKLKSFKLPVSLQAPLYVLVFSLITSAVVLGLTTLWHNANPPVAYTTENLQENLQEPVETEAEVVFVSPSEKQEEVPTTAAAPPDLALEQEQFKTEEQQTVAAEASEKTTPAATSAPDLHKMEHPIQGKIGPAFEFTYSEIYQDYRLHPGFDYSAQEGSKVLAALEGVVGSIEPSSEGGYIVTLKHGDGWETTYTALETEMELNQYVPQGGLLGRLVGSVPGETAAGSHLHFELRKDGKAVNPGEYLR